MGEFERSAHTGINVVRAKRLWAAVALGVAALFVAVWATAGDKWPWSGLPDRACWGSIDQSLLTGAAPSGDGSWKVTESKDRWGEPECTVSRGDWRLSATVMKTPLESHLWWSLGRFPLPQDLPGMISANGDRVNGWLHLPQCPSKLVNVNVNVNVVDVNVPGAKAGLRATADLAARTLLAVGNARIAECGGEPFPVPRSFDWPALKPVRPSAGELPCGVADAGTVRKWADGEVTQLGGGAAISAELPALLGSLLGGDLFQRGSPLHPHAQQRAAQGPDHAYECRRHGGDALVHEGPVQGRSP